MVEKSGRQRETGEPGAPDWRAMVRPVVMRVFKGALQGISKLDDEARDVVFNEMARKCAEANLKDWKLEATGDMDIDTLIAEIPVRCRSVGRNISREANTIWWEAYTGDYGIGCMCVLRLGGLIEPRPEQCRCTAHFVRHIIEMTTGRKAEVEVLDSPLMGGEHCQFRMHLEDS